MPPGICYPISAAGNIFCKTTYEDSSFTLFAHATLTDMQTCYRAASEFGNHFPDAVLLTFARSQIAKTVPALLFLSTLHTWAGYSGQSRLEDGHRMAGLGQHLKDCCPFWDTMWYFGN